LNEPVSYLCYKIANKKEDAWICAIGCITDSFLPDFMEDFKKDNPELIDYPYKNAFDILYNTRLGKITQIVSFALKDSTSNVVSMMKFLMKARGANDILEENIHTKSFLNRFAEINEKYQRILKKQEDSIKGDILFFNYSGDLSISQYTANELLYRHPDKVIVVAYSKNGFSNVSLRWNGDIRTAFLNAIKDIDGASGGGHEHSTGGRMPTDKLDTFKKNLLEEIEKAKKS
jgi:hypothetical protein